ncbi:type II toxin-antitoxin system PemK/MazF family toxin [Actinocrinis sp.]|uniref:type II toxin-antitoxin system PemK/MazF family toxin n=1 Tax=Actinocrinis sp. TaxID=1920516 RepID=UPI0032C22AF3
MVVVRDTPLRGEVWACALPRPLGPQPVVVLTANRIAQPLSSVTVALITGSDGPKDTHVRVGPDTGLTKYDESYVNCTDLHSVDKPHLRRRLGLLSPGEMRAVETNLRLIMGLD